MAFPCNHKTVMLLDHTMVSLSGVKLELDTLSKNRNSQQTSLIPVMPVTKTLWTCAVEAIAEYCRIVWDIFPTSKLLRFIASGKSVEKILTWDAQEQNLTNLINAFMSLGPPKSATRNEFYKGIKSAIECLLEPSAIQLEKSQSSNENSLKVLNKGRVIVVTKLDYEGGEEVIKNKFQETLIQCNKSAISNNDNLMPVNHCDLVLINLWPDDSSSPYTNKYWYDMSSIISCELFNLQCGVSLAPKLCSLVLKHYDLASTTVTGIPMREEPNASSSANYDVELFHPAAAHAAILRSASSETAHLKTVREGTDYETVTLKWCTPRSTANQELYHCSSSYRITSVDVKSRPSSCLTNFLLNGKWVMLEMPRKTGSNVTSHMLACHGGDIYIHTLYIARSILEDPPSVSEGCGGRVTDYRIPDFGSLIKANRLVPYPDSLREEGEDSPLPFEKGIEQLERHTKVWPITLSSTALFNLGSHVEVLISLMLKDTLTEDQVVECKKVIYCLIEMEERGDPLISSSTSQRSKGQKREDQYSALWSELENYILAHNYSQNHANILECLKECINKNNDHTLDDKESALKEKDINMAEKPECSQNENYKHKVVLPTPEPKKKKLTPPPLAPLGSSTGISLLSLWENKITAEHSKNSREFQGRLKAENNITKLYVNLHKDKDERKKM